MATLTLTLAASSDDALVSDLAYDATGTTMQVGGTNSTSAANTGQGFRFTNVTIAAADTINSVILKLMKSATVFSTQNNRWVFANEDNSATFSSGSPPGSRAIVATIVPDSNNLNETDGTVYNFPRAGADQITLGTSLAAVKNRAGWASGNAVSLINNSKQDASFVGTSARKAWHTWDSATASSEPQLVIDYTAGATWSRPLPQYVPVLI